MNYSLFSSSGNLMDSFTNETEARDGLRRIGEAEPESASDVALYISEDDGDVTEGPMLAVAAADR